MRFEIPGPNWFENGIHRSSRARTHPRSQQSHQRLPAAPASSYARDVCGHHEGQNGENAKARFVFALSVFFSKYHLSSFNRMEDLTQHRLHPSVARRRQETQVLVRNARCHSHRVNALTSSACLWRFLRTT